MSATLAEPPTLTTGVAPVPVEAEVTGLAWLGDVAAFALADGDVLLASDDEHSRVKAHPEGAILVAAADGRRIVTGGDDGRLVATTADGQHTIIHGTGSKSGPMGGAWIDAIALHRSGGMAWAAGKSVTARDDKGKLRSLDLPSAARGLAFAPKGFRVAAAHYGGATLWYPGLETEPEQLDWKGSHIDVVWSPDGRFVVTSMQENALHGWRLKPDRGHMRMSGYGAKPRSLSWSFGGAWLATSGADAAIIWPFASKEGPMGKPPRECGVRPAKVTAVAFHPNVNVLAIGYEDGCILMVRLEDGGELLVRHAGEGGAVSALGWSRKGQQLAFGTREGRAGILALPG